jgi:hypothetical protein
MPPHFMLGQTKQVLTTGGAGCQSTFNDFICDVAFPAFADMSYLWPAIGLGRLLAVRFADLAGGNG